MPSKKLTSKFVETIKPVDNEIIYWDTEIKGARLGLRVYPSGLKKYLFNYRNKANKQCRITIGSTETLSLSEARKKALELLIQVNNGNDPAEEKNDYKKSLTFKELADSFLNFKKNQIRCVTFNEYKRIIERDLLPLWRDYKVQDINRKMVQKVLDDILVERNAKTLVKRVKALIHQIFGFAMQREHIALNPCLGIELKVPYIRKTRFLSEEEITIFLNKIDHVLEEPTANLLKLILITAQRPGEVAKMEWKEIQNDIWTLPSDKAKNKIEHVIPIVGIAKDILSTIKEKQILLYGKGNLPQYVFQSHTGSHLTWFTHACARLVKAMGMESFTPRDLRRTAATHIRSLGFSMETIKKILNHKEESTNVTAIYNRYNELSEMIEALEEWSIRLGKLKKGERFQNNVISFINSINKKAA